MVLPVAEARPLLFQLVRSLGSPKSTAEGFEYPRRLLVTRLDYELVRRAISDLCLHTEGADWNEIATKLSRHPHWEFEDYREAP